VSNDQPFQDVSVYIEQAGTNKFKIQSDQLEQIGTQLRGRPKFSIFQSIILPLIVSVATIIFSSAFQYVSWFNSVGVKYTTDVADKAAHAYETAAAAIGARHYAMFVFLPSLRDLIHAKAKTVSSAVALTTEIKDGGTNVKKRKPAAARSRLGPTVQSVGVAKDDEISLHKYHLDIKQKRFASYYKQLKLWNENYDRLLSDIEYALDRPVFEQAKSNENFQVTWATTDQIDCLNSVTEELQKLRLNPDSLKFRFAGINACFMKVSRALNRELTEAISKPLPTFSESTESQIKKQYDALLDMANEFRCYAHQRIDYYNSQKELAIFSLTYVWRSLTDATKTGALKHFEDSTKRCNGLLNAQTADENLLNAQTAEENP